MIKLSSIVIAKNEEENIARCLQSQLNCIDQIIVLIDDTTDDNTLNVVKSFSNVKYEIVKWLGYVKTKELALTKTTNDWILWIDADEEITYELSNELNEFKLSQPEYSAYSIPRKAYFLGKWIKHCGWYPARAIRLFNKNEVKFSDKEVHENLIVSRVGKLKNHLNHYTDPTISHYYEKFNIYTTIAAKELRGKNKTVTINDLLFRPLFLFIKMYIFKLGFLDGFHGFALSIFSANYVFTKYAKLWELNKKTNN